MGETGRRGAADVSWEIGPATDAEVAELARIWHEGWVDAHAGHVDPALVAARAPEHFPGRMRARVAHTLVCRTGRPPAGFAVTVADELEQLYVDRAWRGAGVAPLLLEAARVAIAGRGHARAWLAVIDENVRARAFYERHGWVDEGPMSYAAEAGAGVLPVRCRRYAVDVTPGSAAPHDATVRPSMASHTRVLS